MISNVGRRRFADLDDRDDLERISLVPVAGPATPPTIAEMQAILAGRTIRVLDLVQDCGCIAGDQADATAARNRKIIQDAVTASGGNGVTLNVRGGLTIDRSIWVDVSNVGFQGVLGTGASIGLLRWGDPVLILGVMRNPGGVALTADYFPDAFGKLDASAVAAPGARFGYKTHANTHLADVFGLAAVGPGYYAIPKLTVAFCYDSSADATAGLMFGLSMGGKAYPWYIIKPEGQNRIDLTYQVTDGTPYGGTTHTVNIYPPTSTAGVHRVVFQLDLTAGTCIGFYDGVQVAVAGVVPSGKTLLANQICPFHINKQGSSAINPVSDYSSTPTISQTYYGLFVGGEPVYRDDGVGQPIKRIDNGATPNDRYLFTDRLTPGGIFTMSITDAVAARELRAVDFMSGWMIGDFGANSRGFVLSPDAGNPWNSLGGYLLADLSFGTGNAGLGQAVVMGNTLYPTFRRCTFGGLVGLGTWGSAANYIVRIENCYFAALGTGLYTYYSILEGYGLRFGRGGKATIRNFSASIKLQDVFIEGNDSPDCFVWTAQGGQTHIVDINTDFEVPGTPKVAAFYNMTGSNFARAGILSVDGFVWGLHEHDKPLFLLDGRDTGGRSALFAARRLYGYGPPDVYVEEHGVEWQGVLQSIEIQQGAEPIVHVGAGESGIMLNALPHAHAVADVTDFAEAVDDRVSSLLLAGDNVALAYDDVAGTLTISAAGGEGGGGTGDHGTLLGLTDDDHAQYLLGAPATTDRNTVAIAAAGQVGMTIRAHATQGTTPLWRLRNTADSANLAEFAAAGYLGIGTAPTTLAAPYEPAIHAKLAAATTIQVESTTSAARFHAKGTTAASLVLEDNNATAHERIFAVTSDGGWLRIWSLLDTYGVNTKLIGMSRHGYINVGFGANNEDALYASFAIKSLGSAVPATIVRAAASQTTNLVEWQDPAGTTVYGTISENGYWTTRKAAAPADGELAAGEMALWFEPTNGAAKLRIKAKQADGTVRTGEVVLT